MVLAFAALLLFGYAAAPAQQTTPAVAGDLATIIQSGSTNSRGYSVVLHNDGSATSVFIGTTDAMVEKREFPAGTVDTKTLGQLLAQIGDVSKIPAGHCPKSVSFGTTTKIEYEGKTSGDLQCIAQAAPDGNQALLQASKQLSHFVQTTLSQLKIANRRVLQGAPGSLPPPGR
ncbi:MAG: hypothetical protein ACLPLR_10175 [Terriglobales bacterium]